MMRAAVLVFAACAAKPAMTTPDPANPAPPGAPPPAPAPAPDAGSASADPPQPATAGPKIGETCSAGDACGEGSCVTYYGIAGPKGPAFKSCEITCVGGGACPSGRNCITIADGPGQVCR